MNWTDAVRRNLTDINIQESLRVAARDSLAEMGPRIFEQGKTPEGSDIGNYSTKPIYINKKQMTSTAGGRETRGGKTKFFSGGYKQYKQSLGRGQNFDMRNFGIMMRDFYTAKEKYSGKEITLTFKEKRNEDIVEADKRMQKAFGLSKKEKESFEKVFVFELSKRLFE